MHGATGSGSGVSWRRAGRMGRAAGRAENALVTRRVVAGKDRDRQGQRRNHVRQRSRLRVQTPCAGVTGLVGSVPCFMGSPGELGTDQCAEQQQNRPHLSVAIQGRGPLSTGHGKLRTRCFRLPDDTGHAVSLQALGAKPEAGYEVRDGTRRPYAPGRPCGKICPGGGSVRRGHPRCLPERVPGEWSRLGRIRREDLPARSDASAPPSTVRHRGRSGRRWRSHPPRARHRSRDCRPFG